MKQRVSGPNSDMVAVVRPMQAQRSSAWMNARTKPSPMKYIPRTRKVVALLWAQALLRIGCLFDQVVRPTLLPPAARMCSPRVLPAMVLWACSGCGNGNATPVNVGARENEASTVDATSAPAVLDATSPDGNENHSFADMFVSNDVASDVASSTDGAAHDSDGIEGDSAQAGGATFACANAGMCSRAAEFCEIVEGGADTGAGPEGQCLPLPDACLSAPSCGCLIANAVPLMCAVVASNCTDSSGQVDVICKKP